MIIIQCKRCGGDSPPLTEVKAEIWFSMHKCKGLPDLKEMSDEELEEALRKGR